jgi:FkbM family methyltransferase
VTKVARTEARPPGDQDDRMAYFDRADEYTPFLATWGAGGALYLVKTEDKHIGRSLFSKQGRGDQAALTRAVVAVTGLLGPDAIAGRTFIDVGANIGTTTIPALLSHDFDAAVAIEPEPENVRVLRLNVLLNDLEDRVNALAVAASNKVGRSELVVDRSRGGKHWIATDRVKLKRKERAETELLPVETVTLDHLAEAGVIEPERTGLLWMDAEGHEGSILEGASALLARGTPLVLEWSPVIRDRADDPGNVERAVAEAYTHFAVMHRRPDAERPSYPLLTMDQLPGFAGFVGRSKKATKTDILLLRLDPDQAAGITDLDDLMRAADNERPDTAPEAHRGLLSRLRSRLSGRR